MFKLLGSDGDTTDTLRSVACDAGSFEMPSLAGVSGKCRSEGVKLLKLCFGRRFIVCSTYASLPLPYRDRTANNCRWKLTATEDAVLHRRQLHGLH
jgi:hypothetical protein